MASKKARGKRAKTRYKLTRRHRPLTINKILADFETGQIVQVNIDPAVHSGLPHGRYQGLTGTVIGKQGKVFCVRLDNGEQSADLFVHPAHLKSINSMVVEKSV